MEIDLKKKAQQYIATGEFEKAETIYRELISISKIDHIVLNNLASVLMAMGKDQDGEVERLLKSSIDIKPDNSDAYNNLGNIYTNEGRLKAAIKAYKKAIEQKSNDYEIYFNLGNTYRKSKNNKSAINAYKISLNLNPNYLPAINNIGICLKEEKKYNESIIFLKKAICLNKKDSEIYYNLGIVYKETGEIEKAINSYKIAIDLNPKYNQALNNLGLIYLEQGNIKNAYSLIEKSIKINPASSFSYNNIGSVYQEEGDLSSAKDSYVKAIKTNQDSPDSHWNLATTLLLMGEYEKGWEEYEWRLKTERANKLHTKPICKKWDGNEIQEDTELLIIAEQGIGDTLHFMRYLKVLKSKYPKLKLCTQRNLHGLIKSSNIHPSPVSPEQGRLISNTKWIPLLSIPKYLKVRKNHPVINEPYIKSRKDLNKKWKKKLSKENKPKIGINWQGNPLPDQGRLSTRSFPLEIFSEISKKIDCSLVSLQKGYGSEQMNTCTFKNKFVSCQSEIDEIWDFEETAGIIENCDLIITCDTSVAHLAGGMGKETWVLLKEVPEWRWGMDGNKTFWYPSMTLFRQTKKNDWESVIKEVLKKLVNIYNQTK